MTAASGSNRQSPSQSQSATPPPTTKNSSEHHHIEQQPQVAASTQQHIEMTNVAKPQQIVPPTTNIAPQQLPPSTSAYFIPSGTQAPPSFATFHGAPFMAAPHLMQQQQQGGQKMSPAYPPAAQYATNFTQQAAPPQQQFQTQKVESPKRNDSAILNSMCNRSQRCGVCKGCTNSACGQCNFCHDSPQFGGPGVKKQSCLERRCHRVLENKLQRDAPSFRARRGCGQCEDCRVPNCNACLVCFDRKYFDNRYIPNAMCARKRCNHAVLLDNSTRMRPAVKKRASEDQYTASPKPPAKRPSPSEQQEFNRLQQQPLQQAPLNGNSPLTQRLLQPMVQPLQMPPQQISRPAFQAPTAIYQGEFTNGANGGFQPHQPLVQMDPNANRLFQQGNIQPVNPCLFQPAPTNNTLFIPAAPPQSNFYFIPQPLQPTAQSSIGGKEIKEDSNGSSPSTAEDPYQPPSYNQDQNGTVVLQAL